ncbi:alpha/beta fold hydrolase [Mesobacterium sp. TK19101]|uniref:Alpha/beta fold hydrolase n=1 Tax=Mesobacterium hydrothermale TaxID=3111907 RepID=A0ABU6HIZ8_9RHOB|nr:alpha/beta fold hydrolase [Mesobacterium sp. TK19101]MEC3861413.1 alpha/beta fold hydrolase [Mesobacterium sp. TK19101]
MSEIVLIHGSCHGAWCWRDVAPVLEALGHDVRAIDLPSHGEDPTPLEAVTLAGYAEAVLAAIRGRAVVVGHSMAGFPISLAAEMAPEKIARLVYLCAYLPWDGYSLVEMRKAAPRHPILKALRRSEDGTCFSFDPAHAREVLYHDCSDDAVAFALAHLRPQPITPQDTKIALGDRFAGVAKSYIRCRQDSAIPAEFQDEMSAGLAPGDVYDLPGSHSPFLADPAGLAKLIDRIARG